MALSIIQLQHLMKCKWWITNFIHTPHGGRIIHQVAICMIIYLVINGRKSGLVNNWYRDVSIFYRVMIWKYMQEKRRNVDKRRKFSLYHIALYHVNTLSLQRLIIWNYRRKICTAMLMENIDDFNIEIN